MLDAHPAIAVAPESRWIARWYAKRNERPYGVSDDGYVSGELVDRLLRKHRLFRDTDAGMTPEELYRLVGDGKQIRYAELISYIFERYGRARGKTVVGNKTPGFVRKLHMLAELWPGAKFVHIMRDGRDVYLSVVDWKKATAHKPKKKHGRRQTTWDEDPAVTAAIWWEWDVRLGREAGAELGAERYYELRYESLVAEPGAECRSLCSFLGVPYDEAMLRHHEGRVRSDARASVKHPTLTLPVTSGLRDWRTQMAPEDVERFEAAAGSLLDELGYARAYPDPDRDAVRHAASLRASFHGEPLPKNWPA